MKNIVNIIEQARNKFYRAVNFLMVEAYWQIGKKIVQEEQRGKRRADYGSFLLKELAVKLTKDYGSGFDESNLRYIRNFYIQFPMRDALRHELTWTHYRLPLKVESENARSYYINESINNNWSTRQLERQINSFYYERILSSKDKKRVIKAAQKYNIPISLYLNDKVLRGIL
jgi:hypothetical protein